MTGKAGHILFVIDEVGAFIARAHKMMNKGVMATGTSRSDWLVIRSPARLVPAPYPQRSSVILVVG